MNNKQTLAMVVAAGISGFLGGALPYWLFRPAYAAQTPQGSSRVLQTTRLEIVDERGNIRAVLDTQSGGEPRLLLGSQSKGLALSSTALFITKTDCRVARS